MLDKLKRRSLVNRTFGDTHALRLLIIAIVIFIVFSILLPGKFFSIRNMQSMAVQFPEFGILAFAIMITMLTGGIDLSIVGTANLAAIFAALTMTRLAGDGGAGMSPALVLPLSVLVAYAAGSLCGLFNGFLVARVGITPILATLGTMSLYTGLGYVMTGGPAITTTQLAFIGNGSILGIPIPVLVFIVVAVIFAVMLNRTTFGFNVYMLGTNPVAARFSGINIGTRAGAHLLDFGSGGGDRGHHLPVARQFGQARLRRLVCAAHGADCDPGRRELHGRLRHRIRAWCWPCSVCSSSPPASTCFCCRRSAPAPAFSSASLPGARCCCW